MKVKLTVLQGKAERDVVLTSDTNASVSAIIDRFSHQMGVGAKQYKSLIVNPGTTHERVLLGTETLGESGLRSADRVELSVLDGKRSGEIVAAGSLRVLSGPDAPAEYPLRAGTNLIGRDRDCDIRLTDPMVSKRHARINVTDMVQLIDEGSANGIIVGEHVVDRRSCAQVPRRRSARRSSRFLSPETCRRARTLVGPSGSTARHVSIRSMRVSRSQRRSPRSRRKADGSRSCHWWHRS